MDVDRVMMAHAYSMGTGIHRAKRYASWRHEAICCARVQRLLWQIHKPNEVLSVVYSVILTKCRDAF